MIAAIVPQFLSADLGKTLAYYRDMLGFETQFEYGKPVYFAGAIRDGFSIFFRHVYVMPPPFDDKYPCELLDAYIRVHDVKALYAEYADREVEFFLELADRPHGFTEFVVKDDDGRLLCFGQDTELVALDGKGAT